jgi:hypothetical protein
LRLKKILRIIRDAWREAEPVIRSEVRARECNAEMPELEVAYLILSKSKGGEVAGIYDFERNMIIMSLRALKEVSEMFKLSERSLKCLILCLIMHEVKHYVDIVCEGLKYEENRELMEKRAEDYGAEWLEKCLENP